MNKHSLDWFWDGCEAQGPFHVLVKLPGQPQALQRVLHQPFAVIGRDVHAHLRLDDMRVGLRHAYFQVIGGQLFVVDLGSPTGIHARGGPVRAGWVPLGDLVGVGPYWLRWLKDGPPDLVEAIPAFDPLAECAPGKLLMPLSLEFLNGKAKQPRWQVDRVMTLIGSASACKVRLRGSRVSPFHCSLIWTPRGAWIVDLLSEGGVRLNGVPVLLASLEHDDRLQVGEFVIRVCYGTTSEAPRATEALARNLQPAADLPTASPAARNRQEGAALNGHKALHELAPSHTAMSAVPTNPAAELLAAAQAMHFPALACPQIPADPSHAALVPIISQFGALQEQMADQFRQTLMMMFQMFSALHKDQMAFFQQEMDRVQQLTQELHLLQIEAAKHTPTPAPAGPRPKAALPPVRSSPALQAAPPADGAAAPARLPTPTSLGNQQPPSPPSDASPAAPAGQDIHVWLCQRMAAIQEERQSRWQKLLGLLGGKPADAS